MLKRDAIDATVIDMRTPGEVSVADLCAWIERNRPELARRIIFTVWNAPDPDLSEAIGKSGCPVVRKPFEIERFLEASAESARRRNPRRASNVKSTTEFARMRQRGRQRLQMALLERDTPRRDTCSTKALKPYAGSGGARSSSN